MTPACPYCRSPFEPEDESVSCEACATPHHSDCYAENNGCTVFGCSKAPLDEPKISILPPKSTGHVRTPAGELSPNLRLRLHPRVTRQQHLRFPRPHASSPHFFAKTPLATSHHRERSAWVAIIASTADRNSAVYLSPQPSHLYSSGCSARSIRWSQLLRRLHKACGGTTPAHQYSAASSEASSVGYGPSSRSVLSSRMTMASPSSSHLLSTKGAAR